jgi:hypothetical protein
MSTRYELVGLVVTDGDARYDIATAGPAVQLPTRGCTRSILWVEVERSERGIRFLDWRLTRSAAACSVPATASSAREEGPCQRTCRLC